MEWVGKHKSPPSIPTNPKFEKMANRFRKITVLFKASPSMLDTCRPRDEVVEINLNGRVSDTRHSLSLMIGCAEEHLWLYHGNSVMAGDIDQRLRWSHVPGFFLDPTVFYFLRQGRPRQLGHMCLKELETLRQKHWKDIISLGWNQDPCKLTSPELEYLRVSGAVVLSQEFQNTIRSSLEMSAYRYLVCVRFVTNPSASHVQKVVQQVYNYMEARKNSKRSHSSKRISSSNRGNEAKVAKVAKKTVHWKVTNQSNSSSKRISSSDHGQAIGVNAKVAKVAKPSTTAPKMIPCEVIDLSNSDEEKASRDLRKDWPLHNLQQSSATNAPSSQCTTRPDPPEQQLQH